MSKEKPSNLKNGHENLWGFFVSLGLLFFLVLGYDTLVFDKEGTTNSKVVSYFFRYLDEKFGKEYVFGFVILVMLLFGIAALRGYLKENSKK
jgi:hypothetical protein